MPRICNYNSDVFHQSIFHHPIFHHFFLLSDSGPNTRFHDLARTMADPTRALDYSGLDGQKTTICI